jgi:SulP family sulfate permease
MAEVQTRSAKATYSSAQADDLAPAEAHILDAAGGRIVLFHVEGPLSFGSARDITRMMEASPEKDALVVDLTHVPFIDTSASMALEEAIVGMREMGDTVILCGVRDAVRDTLARTGVLDVLGADQIAATRLEALELARDYIANVNPRAAAPAV